MKRVLIVDDEPKLRRLLAGHFDDLGYTTTTAGSINQSFALLEKDFFDLVITDVRLPDGSGIDILKQAKAAFEDTQVIVITAYGTVHDAVDAMRIGAYDYILKPFELDTLSLLAERALETSKLKHALQRHAKPKQEVHRQLVSNSPAMRELFSLLGRVAPTPSTVLLLGESGSGKGVLAREIHRLSQRPNGLIHVNCAAIPPNLIESELFGHVKGAFTGATSARKGCFEYADEGTLFLDEIAEVPLELQPKLLHVLEEGRFTRVGASTSLRSKARIIAATNCSLEERIKEGRFRQDLYFRLSVFPIQVPPLRDRIEDIPALAHNLVQELAHKLGRPIPSIPEDFIRSLKQYQWPGNVRELRNILERAFVLTHDQTLHPLLLPPDLRNPQPQRPQPSIVAEDFNRQVDAYKRAILLEALQQHDWVKKDAAHALGLSPRALSHHIAKYDLDNKR